MTYEFAKYPDGTLGVFSDIGKKENGASFFFKYARLGGLDLQRTRKGFDYEKIKKKQKMDYLKWHKMQYNTPIRIQFILTFTEE